MCEATCDCCHVLDPPQVEVTVRSNTSTQLEVCCGLASPQVPLLLSLTVGGRGHGGAALVAASDTNHTRCHAVPRVPAPAGQEVECVARLAAPRPLATPTLHTWRASTRVAGTPAAAEAPYLALVSSAPASGSWLVMFLCRLALVLSSYKVVDIFSWL